MTLTYRLLEWRGDRCRVLARRLSPSDARRLRRLLTELRPIGDDTDYSIAQETGA